MGRGREAIRASSETLSPSQTLPKGSSDPNPLNEGDSHFSRLAGSVASRDLVQHSKCVRERKGKAPRLRVVQSQHRQLLTSVQEICSEVWPDPGCGI